MTPFGKRLTLSLDGVSVMIGIPCADGKLPWQVVQSLLDTSLDLRDRGVKFDVQVTVGCSIVQHARSHVCNAFLNSSMSRLFMIDADIRWKTEDFVRMLALSTRMPVVCAAYPMKRDGAVFAMRDPEPMKANEYGCLPINGLGLGFTVVTREVIERLAERSEKVIFGEDPQPKPYLFRCDVSGGYARGEDMAFFEDVREMGFPVHLDPHVSLGHIGTKEYAGSIMDAMKRVA